MFINKNKVYNITNCLYKYYSRGCRVIYMNNYGIVEPATVSPMKDVPSHIKKPSYYKTGKPQIVNLSKIEIKKEDDIQHMRDSCKIASKILKNVGKYIKEGITTDDIDTFVHNQCIENNCYPSPLRYKGFPKSICTSVNNVAVHGIPDSRPLQNGDIINVDITVYFNNFHGDCSKTFMIGDVDEQGKELVAITNECLNVGISVCGPNVPFTEIGAAIHKYATCRKFTVVPAFLGHGIGRNFHCPPEIHHTLNTYPGKMKPGMTFTIEPVITLGEEYIELLDDGWTAVTADDARAAQAEHTILITKDGHEILTK